MVWHGAIQSLLTLILLKFKIKPNIQKSNPNLEIKTYGLIIQVMKNKRVGGRDVVSCSAMVVDLCCRMAQYCWRCGPHNTMVVEPGYHVAPGCHVAK